MSFLGRLFGSSPKSVEEEPNGALVVTSRDDISITPEEERAPQGPRIPKEFAIIGPVTLSEQINRIGGNLRPLDVSQIIQEADTGWTKRLMDLGNESRQRDGHLQGVLFTRETVIASLPWQIAPFATLGQKPKAKDVKIAQWLQDTLSAIYGKPSIQLGAPDDIAGFRSLLAHLSGAAFFGFAPAETMWGKRDGMLVPSGFSLLQQRRFIFRIEDGRLCWSDNNMPEPIDIMKGFPPGKFIVHRPRINGDVPCREGLIRPLMWAALFRNWDIRDWLQLAELAWKPYRTGQYTRDASQKDISTLIQTLRAMATSGVAVFPETTQFKVEWPKHSVSSGQSMHGELAAFFGNEMSKCVLGQTLTTEAGQKGARALGQIHDLVRKDILESDSIQLAATIQAQLIEPMVRLNFGTDAKIPRFSFITEETADIEQFSKGIVQLRTSGMEVPAKWVRDRIGMPVPMAGDEMLGPMQGPQPPAPPGGAAASDGAAKSHENETQG